MKFCPNVACPHRQHTGTPAEYDVDRPDCADCGAELADGPAYYAAPAAEAAARPLPPGFVSRIVVTAVALAVAIAGPRLVPLPGVDTNVLPPSTSLVNVSVFALGLRPIFAAALLVEFVAWLVPPLRPLRHAGPAGREKLGRAMIFVAMGLALAQAYAISTWMYLAEIGTYPSVVVIGSLLAGMSLLVLLAAWVTRRGLGSGYALLFLVPELVAEGERLYEILTGMITGEPPTAVEIAPMLGIPVLLVATTVACSRWPAWRDERVRTRAAGAEPYRRGADAEGANPPPLRLPASGLAPVLVVASVDALLRMLLRISAAFGLIPFDGIAWYLNRDGGPVAVLLVLTAALVLVFGWQFQTPTARQALWHRVRQFSPASRPLDEGNAEVLAALRKSVLPLCVFVILPLLVDAGPGSSSSFLPLLTVLVLDLVAEIRARSHIEGELVSVWPEQRVFAADMVAAVLRSEGIPVLLRGIQYRTMARFLHPFVPIEVMVPESHAAEATRIVRQILSGEAPPPEVRPDEPEKTTAPKMRQRKKKSTEDEATA
ncbi:putative signal transducing protein [Polyangium sorediatum]|uniref:DUF2007 domain-containing protein n=1 Tax=Polyangium sorediatum TaxID=889274 RepID=A0ABT6NKU7_9BACT|nr:DUF2007 domain-containing protein [Polyangium sorediatum]MDI1428935.1 DUF2007 domain-containing protein [Polyangium sorediatum]